ncbi:hypothetical protein U1Q18_037949 [Sarracenia purpurea var. burkii]
MKEWKKGVGSRIVPMAMVGGIYGTRGDGFFVISDYGAPMMGESRFALELIANLIQTEALPNDEAKKMIVRRVSFFLQTKLLVIRLKMKLPQVLFWNFGVSDYV